jgi:hypothetical protein
MAPLRNQRHERFCAALAEGKTADEAYVEAGFQENRGNASRLKAKESILNRLAELQAEAARRSEITIEGICAELDAANAIAKERGQSSALVSAATLRAKFGGLMVERVEVGSPNEFADCKTLAEIIDQLCATEAPGVNFTPEERAKMQGLLVAMGELLSSRKAELPRHHSQRQIELSRGNGFKRIGR